MRKITVADDNLFALAARLLGDATLWIYLAQINDLPDPFIEGPRSLSVPPSENLRRGGTPS